MRHCSAFAALLLSGLVSHQLKADDNELTPDAVRDAISKSIPLLENGSRGSADHRQCFTCHNQAVPVFALVEARKRGFQIDQKNLDRQLKHTAGYLARGRENYLQGRGQGGKSIMAGYALWTLEAGEQAPDDITAAVTSYCLHNGSKTLAFRRPL